MGHSGPQAGGHLSQETTSEPSKSLTCRANSKCVPTAVRMVSREQQTNNETNTNDQAGRRGWKGIKWFACVGICSPEDKSVCRKKGCWHPTKINYILAKLDTGAYNRSLRR